MCGYNICTTSDKASLKRKRKTSDVNSSTSKKSKVIDSGPKPPQSLVEARSHTQTSKEQLRKKQKAPKVRGEGEGPAGYRNSGRGWLGPT